MDQTEQEYGAMVEREIAALSRQAPVPNQKAKALILSEPEKSSQTEQAVPFEETNAGVRYRLNQLDQDNKWRINL